MICPPIVPLVHAKKRNSSQRKFDTSTTKTIPGISILTAIKTALDMNLPNWKGDRRKGAWEYFQRWKTQRLSEKTVTYTDKTEAKEAEAPHRRQQAVALQLPINEDEQL